MIGRFCHNPVFVLLFFSAWQQIEKLHPELNDCHIKQKKIRPPKQVLISILQTSLYWPMKDSYSSTSFLCHFKMHDFEDRDQDCIAFQRQ